MLSRTARFSGVACILLGGLAAGPSATRPVGPSSRPPAPPSQATMPTSRIAEPFVPRTITTSDGLVRPYAVFVPDRFRRSQAWPLVVFLHGSGEAGSDGVRQTRVGLGPFLVKHRKTCPFLAVFPQAQGWFRGPEAKAVFEIIAQVERDYPIDLDRVYLTGLSMGGFGAWELAVQRPDLFAAIVPICGGGPVKAAERLKEMPIWCFHGAKDDHVPVQLSRMMVTELRRLGAKPTYTEFAEARHNSWDRAYATRGLFPWMLAQRRAGPPAVVDAFFEASWVPLPATFWWLRIDSAVPGEDWVHLRGGAVSPSEVQIVSRGIRGCSVLFDRAPQADPPAIRVVWQGQVAYEGPMRSEIKLTAPTTAPASGPASRPRGEKPMPG